MSVMQRASQIFQKAEESGGIPLGQILGTLFLIATLALAAQVHLSADLILLALIGFFLCATYQQKGCIYAFLLLALLAAVKHGFFESKHLWTLGIEGSLGCAFVITALSFAQDRDYLQSLQTQVETRTLSLHNLEEELTRLQEVSTQEQVRFEGKLSSLQKELEEIQSHHSSLSILNEVLRKNTARVTGEKEDLELLCTDLQKRLGFMQLEVQEKEEECKRLVQKEALASENKWLLKELNGARFEREQTHLINETLARMHAKESLKAKEGREQICQLLEEKAEIQKQLSFSKEEIQRLESHLQQLFEEVNQSRDLAMKQEHLQAEKILLQERLGKAQEQIAFLEEKLAEPHKDPVGEARLEQLLVEKAQLMEELKKAQEEPVSIGIDLEMQQRLEEVMQERAQLADQLKHAQEQVHQLAQVEPLYKQLRKQFDEKNGVLHQTRSQLFKLDTELQTLRIEKEQMADCAQPMVQELQEELEKLAHQISDVEEENLHLQELISHLNEQIAPLEKRKRKEKAGVDQELLF